MRVLKLLSFSLLGFGFAFGAWSAEASRTNQAQQEACVEQMNQRTAALVTRDWSELERLSERYVKKCKGVFDQEDLSQAYKQIATANIELRNPKKALSASNSCLEIHYSNAGCHVSKTRALIRLTRLPEARSSLEKAERLIAHLIPLRERMAREASADYEKEFHNSKLNELEADRDFVQMMRKLLDEQ